MARSVDTIQAEIITNVQAQPELAPANSTSRRAIWRLWTFVVAVAINLLEQLMDIFQTNVEATVALSAPQTALWVQDKVFKFQYSATDPQIIQLIDLVPQYPVVNSDLTIVTRCSVKTNIASEVLVKVAKEEPPTALDNLELSALQSYINTIGVAGISYAVSSTASDKIYIEAIIYFQGQYSSVIQANVIAAIESYLANIPFDGVLRISDLEIAIKSVAGVNDSVLNNVIARADVLPFGKGTRLIIHNELLIRLYNTTSGYIVGETHSTDTLADTLTFIAE